MPYISNIAGHFCKCRAVRKNTCLPAGRLYTLYKILYTKINDC